MVRLTQGSIECGANRHVSVPDAAQERLRGVLEKGEFVTWFYPTDRKVRRELGVGCLIILIVGLLFPVLVLLVRNVLTAGVAQWGGVVGLCIVGLVYVVVWHVYARKTAKLAKGTAYIITNKRAIFLGSCGLSGRRELMGRAIVSLLPTELKQRVVEKGFLGRGDIVFWRRRNGLRESWDTVAFENIPDVRVADDLLAAVANLAKDSDCPNRAQQDMKWSELADLNINNYWTASEEAEYYRKLAQQKAPLMPNHPWLEHIVSIPCSGLIVSLVVLVCVGNKLIPEYHSCWRMRDAMIVPAKVLRVEVDEYKVPRILYSYEIKGRTYTNDRPVYFKQYLGSGWYEIPWPEASKLWQYHKGDVIEAYVDRHNPGMSVLDRIVTTSQVAGDLFVVLFSLAFGAGFLVVLLMRVARIGQQR